MKNVPEGRPPLSRMSSFINERNSCGREEGVNTREAAAARAGVCGAYPNKEQVAANRLSLRL